MPGHRDSAIDHESWMRLAIAEAELARGGTGDNPWVGCMLIDARGEVLGRGHTQGPGEDHAEIVAVRQADARGLAVEGTIMYSTLEPCSFHGRTPACSRVIVDRKIAVRRELAELQHQLVLAASLEYLGQEDNVRRRLEIVGEAAEERAEAAA